MSFHVQEGILTIEGENGQRIGTVLQNNFGYSLEGLRVNPNYTAMRVYVGKAGASLVEVSGADTNIMPGWFEVRADGAVGVNKI